MKLMDTDICIDLLRKHPAALAWLVTVKEPLGIPGFVALELVIGSQNRIELRKVERFIQKFILVWPTEADMQRALTDYAPLKLAYGIGGMDTLIAATATGRGDTLLTLNLRHFSVVPGLTLEKPYNR